jgi:hypothetical protein
VVDLHTYPEGVITLPNDSAKYGAHWAGKILVGAGARRLVYAIDAQGNHTTTDLGFCPGDFHIVPQNQDLYWLDFKFRNEAPSTLAKIPREYFANVSGDLVIVQSGEFQAEDQPPDNGELFLVHWTGTAFIKMKITDSTPRHLEHAVFSPLDLSANP